MNYFSVSEFLGGILKQIRQIFKNDLGAASQPRTPGFRELARDAVWRAEVGVSVPWQDRSYWQKPTGAAGTYRPSLRPIGPEREISATNRKELSMARVRVLSAAVGCCPPSAPSGQSGLPTVVIL